MYNHVCEDNNFIFLKIFLSRYFKSKLTFFFVPRRFQTISTTVSRDKIENAKKCKVSTYQKCELPTFILVTGWFFNVFFGGSSFLYASSPVTRIMCWQFTFLQTTDTCIILTFLKCLHCYFMTHLSYKEVEVPMELMVTSQWLQF